MISLLANHRQQELCPLFVHSHKNALLMKNRRKLKGIKNPLNEKYIYINEPLGAVEQSIFSQAQKRGLILTSGNCKISVLCSKTGSDEEFAYGLPERSPQFEKSYQKASSAEHQKHSIGSELMIARKRPDCELKVMKKCLRKKRQMINKNFLAEA